MNSIYQTNPYVVIDENDNKKIVNTVTGEKLLCGDKIIDIINYLENPSNFDKLCDDFNEIKDDLHNIINSLVSKKFLIKDGNFEDAITAIKPYSPHLFNLPYLSDKKLELIDKRLINFIGVPLGIGNRSNNSSSLFPNLLRSFTNKYGIHLNANSDFDITPVGNKEGYTNLLNLIRSSRLYDSGNIFLDSKESSIFMYDKIYKISKALFSDTNDNVPFFIGGDHSISFPLIKAALEKYGDNLCVIHFDAHTDTYSSTYDKIIHNNDVHHHGNFLSKCFNIGLNHAYQFGIRGVVNINQKNNDNRTIYWAHQIKETLKNQGVFENLPKDKKYYITFDFDIIDPIYFKGTTTPVINGLTIQECKDLIRKTLHDKEIIGIDIVELYGDNEESELTKQIACDIIFELLNIIY